MKINNKQQLLAYAFSVALGLCSFVVNAGVTVTYYHNDALGSPVAATDENGDVLWREDYQPYGTKISDNLDAAVETVGYTGHRYDVDTGLVYAGARMYDPDLGRFMGVDPVGALAAVSDPVMFNRYSYVGNNPYGYVDPNGEERVGVNFVFNLAVGPFGGKVRFDMNYDTTHKEVNVLATGGYKAGAQLGAKFEAYMEPSKKMPTGNRAALEAKIKAEAVAEVKTPVGSTSAKSEAFVAGELSSDTLFDVKMAKKKNVAGSWGPVSIDNDGRKSIGIGGNVGAAASAQLTGKITLSTHTCSNKNSCK